MKLLSISIVFGFLLLSFNYVWMNRIEIKNDQSAFVLINKWTGNHCVFAVDKKDRNFLRTKVITVLACDVDEKGKIIFP